MLDRAPRKGMLLALWLTACSGRDETSRGDDEEGGVAEADDGGIVDAGQQPPPPPPPQCTPRTGEPCAAGESCVNLAPGSTGCVPEGPGQHGDSCQQSFDCARTLMCWSNVCSRTCESPYFEMDDCDDESLCWDMDSFGPYCIHRSDCDVLGQALCPPDQMCAMIAFKEYTDCMRTGDGGQEEVCDMATDCQRGFQCVDSVCRQFCNASGPEPSCDRGECRSAGYQSFSGADVGYCY